MTIWRAGMKAVCVKRGEWTGQKYESDLIYPAYGQVLTVRTVGVGFDGDIYLRFVEIKNPKRRYKRGFEETRFAASRFRPITERKSENKHFATLRDLLTNPNKVLEDA